jgi:hypothetical protein
VFLTKLHFQLVLCSQSRVDVFMEQLTSHANIRLSYKGLGMTNGLAYCVTMSISIFLLLSCNDLDQLQIFAFTKLSLILIVVSKLICWPLRSTPLFVDF